MGHSSNLAIPASSLDIQLTRLVVVSRLRPWKSTPWRRLQTAPSAILNRAKSTFHPGRLQYSSRCSWFRFHRGMHLESRAFVSSASVHLSFHARSHVKCINNGSTNNHGKCRSSSIGNSFSREVAAALGRPTNLAAASNGHIKDRLPHARHEGHWV